MNKKFEKKTQIKNIDMLFVYISLRKSNKKNPQNKTKSIKINKNILYFIG